MENRMENRVTEGLLDWTDKENRLRSVFGNDVIKGKDFLQSKRDFFNNLYQSCRRDASPEEKMMLNVIRGEMGKLDKLIYPNPVARMVANITAKVKEGIKSYRDNRAVKNEVLSIRLKQKPVDYSKRHDGGSKENKNELHESVKESLNTYKKKGAKAKSEQTESNSLQKNNDTMLPKKKVNPRSGHSIY